MAMASFNFPGGAPGIGRCKRHPRSLPTNRGPSRRCLGGQRFGRAKPVRRLISNAPRGRGLGRARGRPWVRLLADERGSDTAHVLGKSNLMRHIGGRDVDAEVGSSLGSLNQAAKRASSSAATRPGNAATTAAIASSSSPSRAIATGSITVAVGSSANV